MESDLETLIRRYLLNELADSERRQVEERLMVDDDFYNQVILAEDDLVEDYAAGRLLSEDRAKFESAFLQTRSGKNDVSFEVTLRRYSEATTSNVPAPEPSRDVSRSKATIRVSSRSRFTGFWSDLLSGAYVRALATALILIGVGVVVWRLILYQSPIDQGRAALAMAFRDERPIEARLSGFAHAPHVALRSGGDRRVDSPQLERAGLLLSTAVVEKSTSASNHAIGQYYLLKGEIGPAITHLQKAVEQDRNNPKAHNDLAAALLEKGRVERDRGDETYFVTLSQSLDEISRALSLDPTLLEPLFNRAICRELMGLTRQAKEDLQQYLEKDATSKWADEARSRLDEIDRHNQKTSQNADALFEEFVAAYRLQDDDRAWAVLSQGYGQGWNLTIQNLLDESLGAGNRLPRDTGEANRLLLYAGRLMAERVHDPFASELAEFYHRTSTQDREMLLHARQSLNRGRTSAKSLEESRGHFAKAKELFLQTGDTWEAAYADFLISSYFLIDDKVREGLSILEPLLTRCQKTGFKWLLSQIHYFLAYGFMSKTEFSRALDENKKGFILSNQLGNRTGIVAGRGQRALIYQQLGDYPAALSQIQQGMAAIGGPVSANQKATVYDATADTLTGLRLRAAALDFQNESLKLAQESGIAPKVSKSYALLGLAHAEFNEYDSAFLNLNKALETSRGPTEEERDNTAVAFAYLKLGHLYRKVGDHDRALNCYDNSLGLYAVLGYRADEFEARQGRFLSLLATGADREASEEIKAATTLFEKHRFQIAEDGTRNGFSDLWSSFSDSAIDFAFTTLGRPARAFDYCESYRARSLLDLMNGNADVRMEAGRPELIVNAKSAPLGADSISRRLTPETRILEYAVLDDKLLIWVVSTHRIDHGTSHISATALGDLVDKYLTAIQESSAEINEIGRELYRLLVAPVKTWLDDGTRVCVVPDKVLCRLPFAALVSPESNRYLFEDYVLFSAPSATIFVRGSESAKLGIPKQRESLLSVGKPLFDATETRLSELSAARIEAEGVGHLYKPVDILVEAEAEEGAVVSRMQQAEVINLATHYLIDDRSPLLSKLVLTKPRNVTTEANDGFLHAYEIYKLKLPRTRLVVLSACQTGFERYYGGEGAVGAARPFLSAGVPSVVASLWPVDSDSTARLITSFHKIRKANGWSAADALRETQRWLIASGDSRLREPRCWAAFFVAGSEG